MLFRQSVLVVAALLLSACATVASDEVSNFDLDFSEFDSFHDERLDRIDAAIEAEIAAGKIAGAVALVIKDDDVAYLRSFGFADLDSREPMQDDAIFRIASMTKAVTSVGVMILYERGHFQLNDPV